jgi:hypothetical protein
MGWPSCSRTRAKAWLAAGLHAHRDTQSQHSRVISESLLCRHCARLLPGGTCLQLWHQAQPAGQSHSMRHAAASCATRPAARGCCHAGQPAWQGWRVMRPTSLMKAPGGGPTHIPPIAFNRRLEGAHTYIWQSIQLQFVRAHPAQLTCVHVHVWPSPRHRLAFTLPNFVS